MMHGLVLRVIQCLIGVFLLAIVAMLVFPGETYGFRAFLKLDRNGCTLQQALLAIRYHANHRRLVASLAHESRVIRTDPEGYELWQTPLGEYWIPEKLGGELFFVIAELELEPYANGDVRVAKGDVVFDCGAHVGTFTRKALAAGASLVVAIEPGTKQIGSLKRNFANEISAKRVIIVEAGVWDKEGQLELHGNNDLIDSFVLFNPSSQSTRMPVITIDNLVSTLHLRQVNFIKMDIEGAEQQALAGASQTLKRFMPKLAIAGYHKPDDPVRIPELVRRANNGYKVECVGCRLDLDQIRPLTMFFH
jgi:FkbM family methyltransferase